MGIFGFNNKKYANSTGFRIADFLDADYTPFGDNMLNNNIVRSCIDYIANAVAKCTINHTKRDKNGNTQIVKSDIINVIKNPNKYQNVYAFMYRLISELYISNNAFVFAEYNNKAELVQLHVVDYSSIELKEVNNELYATFFLTYMGKNVTVPYADLIHIRRHYNSRTFYADSSNKCLNSVLETNNVLSQGIQNVVKLSTKLKIVLKYTGVLKEQEKQREIDKFIKMLEDGEGVAGIDAKCDLSTIKVDPAIVDFETIATVKREIYAFFGITEELVNGSASEQCVQNFYDQVISPILAQLSAEFTKKLFTDKEILAGNNIIFTAQSMLFASLGTKTTLIKETMSLGLLTVNEARAILGLEPIANGDRRLQSLNFVNAEFADNYQMGKVGVDSNALKANTLEKQQEEQQEEKKEEVVIRSINKKKQTKVKATKEVQVKNENRDKTDK